MQEFPEQSDLLELFARLSMNYGCTLSIEPRHELAGEGIIVSLRVPESLVAEGILPKIAAMGLFSSEPSPEVLARRVRNLLIELYQCLAWVVLRGQYAIPVDALELRESEVRRYTPRPEEDGFPFSIPEPALTYWDRRQAMPGVLA